MKTIYYVIEKQLESSKWGEETNGNKDVRAYEVRNGKLELIAEITIDSDDNTEKSLLSELETKSLIQTKPNLIEL
jgi:hypothetical protein